LLEKVQAGREGLVADLAKTEVALRALVDAKSETWGVRLLEARAAIDAQAEGAKTQVLQ